MQSEDEEDSRELKEGDYASLTIPVSRLESPR